MREPTSEQLRGVFRTHGVTGAIKEVSPRARDEAVFLVSAVDAAATTNRELAIELQRILGRKVWVISDMALRKMRTTTLYVAAWPSG